MYFYCIDTEESDDIEEVIVLNKEGQQVEKNLSKFDYFYGYLI